jgi:hypothetical protein
LINNKRKNNDKKKIVLEKRIKYKIFGELFEEDYFVKYLKIPSEYVEGFKYYAVENKKFIVILESKKK